MSAYPYEIIHVQLENGIFPDIPVSDVHGRYIVFWKKNQAVGDCYLEKGIKLNREHLNQVVIPDTIDEPAHFTAVDVSIVICTRNRSNDLKKCLESLRHQLCKPAEIVVVDNAPTDDSTLHVAKQFPDVKYVREPRPGLDIARNTGAKNASAAIIAYTDDDVELHPMWLYYVHKSFDNIDIKAMTGLVIAAELATESQQIFEKHWSFNRGYINKYYDSKFYSEHLNGGPPVWEIGAGANMAFRKNIFEELGYFDERLDVGAAGCNGDSEMWFRILANGGTIHYNPRAIAFHTHRREIKQLKRQIYNYMRGFAAAALIQQQYDPRANYKRHLFRNLPDFYLRKIVQQFPFYRFRYRTIFQEMTGLFSGVLYYIKHRKNKA